MRHPCSEAQKFCAYDVRKREFVWFSLQRLATTIVFVTSLICTLSSALAADPSDPVLNLLLQKGIISQEELDKTKAEAEAIRTNNATLPPMESKWKINNAFKSI